MAYGDEIEDLDPEPIPRLRRLTGFGTMLLGAFALYYCLKYIGALWDTPQRPVAIGVTVASLLVIFIGIVIGFPELLPSKLVSLSILCFGVFTMLVGVLILAWFAYNILIAWQKQFRLGNPSIAIAMIVVGYTMAKTGYRKLRKIKTDFDWMNQDSEFESGG